MNNSLITTQEELFHKLKYLTPLGTIELLESYNDIFPKRDDRYSFNQGNNISMLLDNVEEFTFEPDRFIPMCCTTQDAIRKVAKMKSGPIYVVEAGLGIGYVGLSALALNEELNNRVKLIGYELGKANIERAREIFEYYKIPKSSYDLIEADATTVKLSLPDDAHILVAEHLQDGFFSGEPQYAVVKNFISQLAEPYYIIPEGVDVYGRVTEFDKVHNNTVTLDRIINGFRTGLIKTGISDRSMQVLTINPKEIEKILPKNGEIIEEMFLQRIIFSEFAKGIADVDFKMNGTALKTATGLIELKNVPFFHNDKENPYLLRDNYFEMMNRNGDTYVRSGTSINKWGHLIDTKMLNDYVYSDKFDDTNIQHQIELHKTLETSKKYQFEKEKHYNINIAGAFHHNSRSAESKVSEIQKPNVFEVDLKGNCRVI